MKERRIYNNKQGLPNVLYMVTYVYQRACTLLDMHALVNCTYTYIYFFVIKFVCLSVHEALLENYISHQGDIFCQGEASL